MPTKQKCGASMKDIFVQSQYGRENHEHLVTSLLELFQKQDEAAFVKDLLLHLNYLLVIFDRQASVDFSIEFVARFLTTLNHFDKKKSSIDDEDLHPLVERIVKFLLQISTVFDKAVRLRSCQVLCKLLQFLGEVQIDEDLCDQLLRGLLDRCKDKVPRVRLHAVNALARLQNPSDRQCKVVEVYMFLVRCDPSTEVRNAVLSNIGVSKLTLPLLLSRCKDQNCHVRRTAYTQLAKHVTFKVLTMQQRIELIEGGLKDRHGIYFELVRQACSEKLLPAWLSKCQSSFVEFIYRLDVINNKSTVELALQQIWKDWKAHELVQSVAELLDETHLIADVDDERMAEKVFCWRYLLAYLKSNNDATAEEAEVHTETLLPSTIELADYVHRYVAAHPPLEDLRVSVQREFISLQLIALLGLADLTDAAGRRHVVERMEQLIGSTTTNNRLIEDLVVLLLNLHTDVAEPVRRLCEMMSEFQDADDQDLIVEQPEPDLIEQSSVNGLAASLRVNFDKTDPNVLIKCLTILCEILKHPKVKKLTDILRMQFECFVLPCIRNEDPSVRNMAFRSLGLCCLLDQALIDKHLVLLLQTLEVDVYQVKRTALEALFDVLLLHGTRIADPVLQSTAGQLASQEPNVLEQQASRTKISSNTADGILSILIAMLDNDDDAELHDLIVEGLSKLLLHQRIYAPKLLSRLILMWFNPLTKDNTLLRHCLGAFLPLFAFSSRPNQEALEEAFMPTLATLLDAPPCNPLAKVDVCSVASFMAELTNRANLNVLADVEDHNIHENLAVKLCHEILADSAEEPFRVRTLCRILDMLQLTHPGELLHDVCRLVRRCTEAVRNDKQSLKTLEKVFAKINRALEGAPDKENQFTDIDGRPNRLDADMQAATSSAEEDNSLDELRPVPHAKRALLNLDTHKSILRTPSAPPANNNARRTKRQREILKDFDTNGR